MFQVFGLNYIFTCITLPTLFSLAISSEKDPLYQELNHKRRKSRTLWYWRNLNNTEILKYWNTQNTQLLDKESKLCSFNYWSIFQVTNFWKILLRHLENFSFQLFYFPTLEFIFLIFISLLTLSTWWISHHTSFTYLWHFSSLTYLFF